MTPLLVDRPVSWPLRGALGGAGAEGEGLISGLGGEGRGGLLSGAEGGGAGGGAAALAVAVVGRAAGGGMGAFTGAGLVSLGEEAFTGDGEGADDEDAREPDHDGDEDGHDLEQGGLIDDGVTEGGMIEDSDGDAPPGEHGVHGGGQEPGAEEIPDFGRVVGTLFGGEEAGDAGEVDAAESDGEDGGPAQAGELEVAEEVVEGEVGGGVVEELEGQQGQDDDRPKDQTALQTSSLE